MLDKFERKIDYLRISVTDLCNLRCVYCMPEEGVERLSHHEILSFEEIFQFVQIATEKGVTKIRLTGGEPLVRKGIVNLVSMLSTIEKIKDFSITTNGILLSKFAKNLKEAGLKRVNISLDTINPQRFMEITRGGDITKVFEGIEMAQQVGLTPIKINCVVNESSSEANAVAVKDFCKKNRLMVRFIRQMDIKKGLYWPVEGGSGGMCSKCNRLRLTSNGNLKPCLFNDMGFNIRALGMEEALDLALTHKPLSGQKSDHGRFYHIGG